VNKKQLSAWVEHWCRAPDLCLLITCAKNLTSHRNKIPRLPNVPTVQASPEFVGAGGGKERSAPFCRRPPKKYAQDIISHTPKAVETLRPAMHWPEALTQKQPVGCPEILVKNANYIGKCLFLHHVTL
jgi:hypothetical protein